MASQKASTAIVWVRNELRLRDHEALTAAARSGAAVLPLYIHDRTAPAHGQPGAASQWWLHESLKAFDADLAKHGGKLIIREGAPAKVLAPLLEETQASAVHATRSYEPHGSSCEDAVDTLCRDKGIPFHLHRGRLLFLPDSIVAKNGNPYRVFTPFWRACLMQPAPQQPVGIPPITAFGTAKGTPLDTLKLQPTTPDWASGLRARWVPGEAAALAALDAFVEHHLTTYADRRDDLSGEATSHLSPHLHFGEISPAQVWHAVCSAAATDGGAARGAETFLKELGWREFSYHLLHLFPGMTNAPLRSEFSRFPWRDDPATLRAWQRGQTGYPAVDAGMRQLWAEGWISNRMRMIVASFLVKHLLLPWQLGAAWFLDTLVDADIASNSASWQWVAGCGTDSAPYFRIFNPILQGKKFDPDGSYVRTWVPELATLPGSDIHAPWELPPLELAAAGIELGKTYPNPIVDHGAARIRALAALDDIKRQ